MCGIAGFTNLDGAPPDASILDAMAAMVRHRGGDDRGTYCSALRGAADTALAFERLSILDLSLRGRQPMVSGDHSVAVLLNGEIYNAFDFTTELSRDHQFTSGTDTEVVLAMYQRDGIDGLLDRLNGMFALVVADSRLGELHLVRDHFGIKPLYWTQCGETILFASEAKAFLAHPSFRAEIDLQHLDEVLAFRYVAGGGSLLKRVHQVRPGHRLTITSKGVREYRYARIPEASTFQGSREDAVDRLDELLTRSVRSQLRSDVKVGTQLSGGIDSALVAIRSRGNPKKGLPPQGANGEAIDACAIAIDDRIFAEDQWIAQAAAVARAHCHRIEFTADDFIDTLDAASWHMDQPISQPNSVALLHLARHARERVTVLLSGEGADEIFAGYRRFRDEDPSAAAFIQATQFHSAGRLARLRPGADVEPAIERRLSIFNEADGDHLSKCIAYEMQTHLVDLLMRQDKMMMAHAIENRVPYLDRDLVAFARSLPADYVISASTTKRVVKDLARRSFDDGFVDRRKSGFNLPLAQYFRHPRFVEVMEDRLLPGMASRGLVDVAVVRRWWRRALSGPATTEAFWIVVALELWAQRFIDR